ncbi:ElyC/SanA/YdcF family protein [Ichthyenterobacterium sp. W332]|uniref:ElyC/SanA/YdcF family protein n=1 Tax=Microcosmobacter mediterraneus TaxID=3075607 RepID=A0ABU2YM28_9FLAO|nr:ElyC/SanA/YdcF family protein [Ichthyenterobacterium sp. W332]MDT0559209.1 ElyC/SanA/YdcF family protein [Ichthyenterobacterium sp. W332]
MTLKSIFKKSTFLVLLVLLSIYIPNSIIKKKSKDKLYSSIEGIPYNDVGLVLGASRITPSGNINLYYKYRVEAAIELYKAGKIAYILVSGDNGRKDYDEPSDFKDDLIRGGIPEDKIFLDYAGFRTLDSVIRAKAIFGQDSITVISQKFHNERAIYLAEYHNMKAIGYNAKSVGANFSRKTLIREHFARTKAFMDITFNTKPKFFGKTIAIK